MEEKGKKKEKEKDVSVLRVIKKIFFSKKSCNKASSIINQERQGQEEHLAGWFFVVPPAPFILPSLSLLLCSFLNQEQFCHSKCTPDVQHCFMVRQFWQLFSAGFGLVFFAAGGQEEWKGAVEALCAYRTLCFYGLLPLSA